MAFSVRRSLAWMMLSQGGYFAFQFGGSVVLSRLLQPYEMGIYAIAYAIVIILSTLRSLGMSNFLVREINLTPEIVGTCFTINAILASMTALAIEILGRTGGAWLGDPGVGDVLRVLSLPPLLSILELVPLACLERAGAFRKVALINLAKVMMTAGVTIVLAMRGYSYMSIAWGTLASSCLSVVCLNIAHHQYIFPRIGFHDWRRVIRFGSRNFLNDAMNNIAARCSDLLLGHFVGIGALGLYSRASGLNGLLWDNIHAVIGRVVFVDFSERRRRSLPLRDSYLRVVAMVTALLWPASAGLAILAGPVVTIVYGATWAAAAPILSCLAIAGFIGASATMAVEVYAVTGEMGWLFRRSVARNTIGLSLFFLGCLGGMVWAAASRMGDSLAAVLLYRYDVGRMTGTAGADFIPIYGQSLVLTVAACSPAALLMTIYDWSPATPLGHVFAAIGCGIAAWFAALWLLGHPLFIEARLAGRQAFGRHLPGV